MKKMISNILLTLAYVMIFVYAAGCIFRWGSNSRYNKGYEKGYETGYQDRIRHEIEEECRRRRELEVDFSVDGWCAVGGCSEHDNCCVSSNLNSGIVTHEPITISDEEPINIMPHYNLRGE